MSHIQCVTNTNLRRLRNLNVPAAKQRGAVLVVGMIMLVLITLMVTSAVSLSTSSLKSVGNMQFRNEATAAANQAIERVLSSPFTDAPQPESINVDIDQNDSTDYTVNFATPVCIESKLVTPPDLAPSSITLGAAFPTAVSNFYQTIWDLNATVTDANNNGATVNIHQGVRVLLDQVQYNAVCP